MLCNGAASYQSDSSTGLQLLGHRYYDPSIGRFLSSDPAQADTNWYAYCDNNPLVGCDPTGLSLLKDVEIGIASTVVDAGIEIVSGGPEDPIGDEACVEVDEDIDAAIEGDGKASDDDGGSKSRGKKKLNRRERLKQKEEKEPEYRSQKDTSNQIQNKQVRTIFKEEHGRYPTREELEELKNEIHDDQIPGGADGKTRSAMTHTRMREIIRAYNPKK